MVFMAIHGKPLGKKTLLFMIPKASLNEKQNPWHTAAFTEKERAVTFIKSYADICSAMHLPENTKTIR